MNEWQLKRNKVSPSIRYERNFYIILQKGHYVKKFLWKHKHFILLYPSKMLYALFSEEILKLSNYIRSCYYYIAWSQVLGPQLQQCCFSYISAINTSQFHWKCMVLWQEFSLPLLGIFKHLKVLRTCLGK